MWDTFETFHEGTKDVKQSKINTPTQQYELFHMEEDEAISSMQMRFTHVVNKLENPSKTILNQDCTNRVLRCMTREWQPTVNAIKESQNINTLYITTLFGKLNDHEHEITWLKVKWEKCQEEGEKSTMLKDSSSKATSSVQEDSNFGEDSPSKEKMWLFVGWYNYYVQKNGLKHNDKILINFRRLHTREDN